LLCYFTCTFNTFNIISGRIQSIHHCLHVIYTSQFGFTNSKHQFCCIKKLGSKAIIMFLAGTLGIILGGLWPYIFVGSIFPEVALSNGRSLERTINYREVGLAVQIKPPC
jgi:hypothetical protein